MLVIKFINVYIRIDYRQIVPDKQQLKFVNVLSKRIEKNENLRPQNKTQVTVTKNIKPNEKRNKLKSRPYFRLHI